MEYKHYWPFPEGQNLEGILAVTLSWKFKFASTDVCIHYYAHQRQHYENVKHSVAEISINQIILLIK